MDLVWFFLAQKKLNQEGCLRNEENSLKKFNRNTVMAAGGRRVYLKN
jgi:hypothetical protein